MAPSPIIKFLRLRPESDSDIALPRYMTPQSAGMDICAAVTKDVLLEKGEIAMLPTGFAMALPGGYEAQIRPRSGLALKHGLTLLNSPGTVDADYRGVLRLIVVNLGKEPFSIRRGERLAQMIVAPVTRAVLKEVEELPPTERGSGGFGHTGK